MTSAQQILTACLSIETRILPPTLHADEIDPAVRFELVRGEPRSFAPGVLLTQSIGFRGAYNSSAALGPIRPLN